MSINPSQVLVRGPLSMLASGFANYLVHTGYTPYSARDQMRLMAHLSRWMLNQGIVVRDLSMDELERFMHARRAAHYTQLRSIKAIQLILAYLRYVGVPPAARAPKERLFACSQTRTRLPAKPTQSAPG